MDLIMRYIVRVWFTWSAFRENGGSTFTEKDKLNYRSRPNHRIGPGCAGRA